MNNYSIKDTLCPLLSEWNNDPISYHLDKIDWRLFITLTFPFESFRQSTTGAHAKRKIVTHRFVCQFCRAFKVWHKRYSYYFREETSKGGQMHIHALLGKKGIETSTTTEISSSIQKLWSSQFNRMAVTEVMELTPENASYYVGYATKRRNAGDERSLDVVDFQSKGLRRELLRLANFPSEESDMLASMTHG
jgi:hypothetical protein